MVCVHHKIKRKEFYDMIIDLCGFEEGFLKVVPLEFFIPSVIFEESNNLGNLVTLCSSPCHSRDKRGKIKCL